MHAIIGLLSLLLATPAFEGKWSGEVPNSGGDKITMLVELKTDGTAELSATDKNGKTIVTEPGKWKKTGDKTIELAIDKKPTDVGKGELLDENTLELTAPEGTKLKLIRSK